jgi:Arc/MetJ-type ribon-helix-helix transcriptional regulator
MADTEKITINLNPVELGQIDLLVQEGFYSNRTDFIRSAIRRQLETHKIEVKESVTRRAMVIGVLHYSRKDLEKSQAEGARHIIKVVGMCNLDEDISPELAQATIESLQVYGMLRASTAVKEALADRIK